jgi:hypothetical protein
MIQAVHVPISVTLKYNHKLRKAFPTQVIWEGREYGITKMGLHHTYRSGRTLYHVFSVAGVNIFFKLVLNTDTLNWTLEEIADNESN